MRGAIHSALEFDDSSRPAAFWPENGSLNRVYNELLILSTVPSFLQIFLIDKASWLFIPSRSYRTVVILHPKFSLKRQNRLKSSFCYPRAVRRWLKHKANILFCVINRSPLRAWHSIYQCSSKVSIVWFEKLVWTCLIQQFSIQDCTEWCWAGNGLHAEIASIDTAFFSKLVRIW